MIQMKRGSSGQIYSRKLTNKFGSDWNGGFIKRLLCLINLIHNCAHSDSSSDPQILYKARFLLGLYCGCWCCQSNLIPLCAVGEKKNFLWDREENGRTGKERERERSGFLNMKDELVFDF